MARNKCGYPNCKGKPTCRKKSHGLCDFNLKKDPYEGDRCVWICDKHYDIIDFLRYCDERTDE